MFSLANRKVLTTAALTAAVVGVASVSTLGATNSWTGGDGNYDTPQGGLSTLQSIGTGWSSPGG